MKKLKELRESFAAKQKELRDLQLLAETEKRDFSADEETKATTLLSEIQELRTKIDLAEKLEANEKEIAERQHRQGKRDADGGMPKEVRQYDFNKALRSAGTGRIEGLELEMHQEGLAELRAAGITPKSEEGLIIPMVVLSKRKAFNSSESRAMTVTGGDPAGVEGGYSVPTEVGTFVDYLRDALVLPELGASLMTGLTGDIEYPAGNADAVASWEGEITDLNESNPTMVQYKLSPKRLGTFVDVSNMLLLQSSMDVQLEVMRMLMDASAIAWQRAAINGDGNGKPLGILSTPGIGSVVGGTNGAAPSYSKFVDLETAVDANNALLGNLAYLINSKTRGYAKRTPIESGDATRIWDRNNPQAPINDHRVGVTNLVPSNLTKGTANGVCSAIIFGDFSKLKLGQWGGMEVIPDRYTQATKGLTRMIINSYVDGRVVRPKSFAAMLDALTA